MEIEFWKQRWQENQIGFHLSEVNPYLINHWSDLQLKSGAVVLVPMCGKSLDMIWLASENYSVVGVECSVKAVESFFNEQRLEVQVGNHRDYTVYQNAAINLLQGDFFKLDKEILREVEAVYDRASLVALPEDMRQEYVNLLAENLPEKVKILLVTLEYEQSLMSGPPFSVSQKDVQSLYGNAFHIELLHQQDILEEQSRFKERGLNYMLERVYKISR